MFEKLSTRIKMFVIIFLFGAFIAFLSCFISYQAGIYLLDKSSLDLAEKETGHLGDIVTVVSDDLTDFTGAVAQCSGLGKTVQMSSLFDENSRKGTEKCLKDFMMARSDVMEIKIISADGSGAVSALREEDKGGFRISFDSDENAESKEYFRYFIENPDKDIWQKIGGIEPYRETRVYSAVKITNDKGSLEGIILAGKNSWMIYDEVSRRGQYHKHIINKDGDYVFRYDAQHPEGDAEQNIYYTDPVLKTIWDGHVIKRNILYAEKISLKGNDYGLVTKVRLDNRINHHARLFQFSLGMYAFVAVIAFIFSSYISIYPARRHDMVLSKTSEMEQKITRFRDVLTKIERESSQDSLTGALNRKSFDQTIASVTEEDDYKFGMILFDLDHFKTVNDTYGHDAGDRVLKELAGLITSKIRAGDTFFRWGGEEFAIIIHTDSLLLLEKLAEKLREHVEKHNFFYDGRSITCSFGVALRKDGESGEEIFKRVDEALYQAKRTGRNKVTASEG